MIFDIVFYVLANIISLFGSIFPNYDPTGSTLLQLPWGMDAIFVQGIQGYKVLAKAFPPMDTILTAFLIYIGFKITIQVLKAVPFLGKTLR